jgi:maleylacetoacetate isomerase
VKLYGYFRSSAAYRVRIALNMKGLAYEQESIHLARGRQYDPEFSAISPQNLVPVLEHEGRLLYQSLPILQFLDEVYPNPPLLPKDPYERNRVRSLGLIVAAEIHPLNNVRVLNYLSGTLKASDEQKQAWYHHWVVTGFKALERRLVPQVANASRYRVDLEPFPTIRRINDECLALEPFRQAMPQNQPDAE